MGYLYVAVGKGIDKHAEGGPSIFYGRPMKIQKDTHLGNIRFIERLHRFSYKQVNGRPTTAGTFSQDRSHIRICLRSKNNSPGNVIDIIVRDGRVTSILSSKGKPLDSIHLDREEIDRMLGPKRGQRHFVRLSDIPPSLQNAVIVSEDPRFYSHMGIDLMGIIRSWFASPGNKSSAQSGDTITRQLAKIFFLPPEKTSWRKLREFEIVLILELRYSKKQLLEMYLNGLYWGQDNTYGFYGVENAANFYFSKTSKHLSLGEAALLAGMMRSPERCKTLKAAKERRNAVLARMQKSKMIGEEDFLKASSLPVRMRFPGAPAQTSYFVDYIQRITEEDLGNVRRYHTGYRYHTSLDPLAQADAEKAVNNGLEEIEQTAFASNEPLQAALVAVDPLTGETIAMVGGRNYEQNKFNRAIDAKRQPGSAFKPFVLLAALSHSLRGGRDLTLSSLVSGEPVSLATPEGIWSPSNYENKTYKKITIRQTIEDSVNTATTRLASDLGFKNVLQTARLAGITSPLEAVPSLPLGSFEVTPRELAYAYTTMASNGIRYDPFALYSVTTPKGDIVIRKTGKQGKAFDPRITYLAGYALEGVLERGTAYEAKSLGIDFPASGKTGTTNGNRDSWFVGYTRDVVCAVWVGYDTGRDTGLTGAMGALRIWARFMKSFYSQSGPLAVTPPQGIKTAVIDPKTGYLATAACPRKFTEAYLTGTEPKKTCPEHPVQRSGKSIFNKSY